MGVGANNDSIEVNIDRPLELQEHNSCARKFWHSEGKIQAEHALQCIRFTMPDRMFFYRFVMSTPDALILQMLYPSRI